MLTQFLVLLVDDDTSNRQVVARVLAAAGWRVLEAADGATAVSLAANRLPHLVILDIMMPGMDGWEALAAIRAADGASAVVPVLAYTSLKVTNDELLARGFDGRLRKGASPDEILKIVDRWRPDAAVAGVVRLQSIFGAGEIDELVGRFRDQLVDALTGRDGEDVHATAHRLAGAAGTLGFPAVSASWLAVSEGQDEMLEQARRDARIAIAAIGRKRG